MNLSDFLHTHSILNNNKEIIFYGGTFSPWHEGHSSCIKLAPNDKPLIVIPDQNPRKDISNQINLEKLKKTVEELSKNTFIYEFFYLQKIKNPTYSWMKDLRNDFPDKVLSLLLGYDSFLTLGSWYESKQLLNIIDKIYVVARLNNKDDFENLKRKYLDLNNKLDMTFLGHHPHESLASSYIKN